MAKWEVRVGPEMCSFYGPKGKVLCCFVKEEWNVSLRENSRPFLHIFKRLQISIFIRHFGIQNFWAHEPRYSHPLSSEHSGPSKS